MRHEAAEREFFDQPVRGLQYMLRRLAMVHDFLPEVVSDGIFGERTLEAVMLFQREMHPPVTGVVDRGTWNAIRDAWQEAERTLGGPRALRVFPDHQQQVMPGEDSDYMIVPQAMFQALLSRLEGIEPDEVNGRHGPASVENIKWLQRSAGLADTGVVDVPTWNALAQLYETMVTAVQPEVSETQEEPRQWSSFSRG
ncbi:MAG: peptidoglycan-binding protein [Clostridium sp.]|nr:peptidoglycan-binding protein [Clostridium sp.]